MYLSIYMHSSILNCDRRESIFLIQLLEGSQTGQHFRAQNQNKSSQVCHLIEVMLSDLLMKTSLFLVMRKGKSGLEYLGRGSPSTAYMERENIQQLFLLQNGSKCIKFNYLVPCFQAIFYRNRSNKVTISFYKPLLR